MQKFHRDDYYDVEEISKILGCSVQNVYKSIWEGRLRSIKYDGVRFVKKEWLVEWRENWRSKQKSMYGGRPTFDHKNGEYSIKDVSKMLNWKEQTVYHLVRTGQLPCSRKGTYIVLHKEDIEAYLKTRDRRKYA